ncbi:MAG: DUF1883 domain-containing protein [Candidatus Hydrogenedentes bacterium]|nr:DUF1883 domain-containing protein [Candidatus Hydrogenedentota bacterium]
MNYLKTEVQANRGDIIEVTLEGNAANVMLLNSENFANYRSGRSFKYIGGFFEKSPAIFTAPNTGKWFVIVDLGNRTGKVRAGVRVIKT